MSDYNIDDILNANDSDEDVDALSVDLEKLLDDDDDDDDIDLISSDNLGPVDLHLYSDSDDDEPNATKNPGQEMPPPPSELFAHDSFSRSNDPELDDLLKEDLDDDGSNSPPLPSSQSSLNYSNTFYREVSPSLQSSLNYSHTFNSEGSQHKHQLHGNHSSPLHTLELAEKREKRHMYTGDKDTVSALQSKLESKVLTTADETGKDSSHRNNKEASENSVISHFKCVCLEMISTQLHRNSQFKQHGPGIATVVKFTPKFIALGTTRGLVLIFDHNQEMRQVIGSSVPTAGRNVYAISALDVSASGDTIFCGYENGEIIIWDLAKGSVIKRISDLHTGRIVRLCLVYGIGDEAGSITGVSNEYSIIVVDSKGVVNKIKLSKSLFLSISVDSECLLDGSAGSILDLSPMPSFSTLSSYPGIVTGEDSNVDNAGSSNGTIGGGGSKIAVITECPSYIPRTDQFIALNSSVRSYIIRVYPQVKIVHRWTAPSSIVQKNKDLATAKKSQQEAAGSQTSSSTPATPTTMNIPAKDSVSLDWTWMPTSYYSELKVASNHAKSLLNPDGPSIHPVIVRGWGDTIEILALTPPTITSTYHPATGTSTPTSSSDIEAIVLATHTLPDNVLTVKWLSNHTSIVVMTTRDVLVLNVPSFSSERLPVTKEVTDILSQHILARSLDNIPSISICVSRERMYLLATDKMYMFYLQSWQEQAEQLLGEGQWLDALALVLDRYKNLEGSLTASQQGKEEIYLKDYIKRYAQLAIMRHTDMSLSASSGGGGSGSHHFLVASICIEYCLLVGGSLVNETLFGDIYAGFTAAQQQSIFMEALESFTVRRQITDLPTKIFSDLVEYCNRAQQYSLLERMVCHLDLTDVNVDSLIRTLKKARLYSGFLYTHAYGLNDFGGAFQSVFEGMLLATGRGKDVKGAGYQFPTPQQVDIGYKLILFIQYAATGKVYPRGGKTVVSALCLTQLIELLICKQYPPVPIAVKSTTADAITTASTTLSAGSGLSTMTAAALTSPQMNFSFPFLFSLSQIDLYALFHTLAQAFKTIYGNSDNGNIVKLNNNNLYFASFGAMFMSVLNFAKYADSHMGHGAVSTSNSNSGGTTSGVSSNNITHQLCFFELFLDLITSSNVSFPMEFLYTVIQHCQKHVKTPLNRAETLIEALITRQLKYLPPTAQVYKELASELEQHFFFMTALKLCSVNSKYRYKATTDTLRTAVVCYIHNNSVTSSSSSSLSSHSSSEQAMQIFPYIHEFFEHLDNTTANDPNGEYVKCCHVLIEFIQDLASVNLHNTKLLMVMYLHDNVELMMEKTKKQQKLQFELLDAMVNGVKNQTVTATTSNTETDTSTSSTTTTTAAAVDIKHDIESSHDENYADESKGEHNHESSPGTISKSEEILLPTTSLQDHNVLVYISQLATFQPKQVLNFLSTHSNYPLDEALKVCKQKSIFNATAYLLERAGDSMAALELCLMEISNTLPEFVSKVESMVSDSLQQSSGGNSGSNNLSFAKSMALLQLLKNPSPSKLIEVFQHLEAFVLFNDIIQLVTGVCSRIDAKSSSSYAHWFHVLDQLLKVKHSLNSTTSISNSAHSNKNRKNNNKSVSNTTPTTTIRDSILQDLSSNEGDSQMARELVGLVVGQSLKAFMSQMGRTVPSQDIVRRITQEEMMGSRFSEFKDVMISMVDSYSYEIALYKTCLRITTSDLLLLRAKRMKQKHRGVRASAHDTYLAQSSPPPLTSDEDFLSTELARKTTLSTPFAPINHRSSPSLNAGGLAYKRHLNQTTLGKKEAFTETSNLIDMAARVVICTELPTMAKENGFDVLVNADMEARIPGTLPVEASFVASYDGF